MNTIIKTTRTIEHHCLQLSYASLRLHPCGLLDKLTRSIEEHGQLLPVIIIPDDKDNQWVLMDGYLRVKALQRLGQDTIHAEIWMCGPAEALLALLTEHQSRPWEIFEEALLLYELHSQHGFSQGALARRIGRDKSWVSRRLALLDHLPEPILQAILVGKLSLWAATRVLAPLARANTSHGESLLDYLMNHHHSTRELQGFFKYYQQSNRQERSKIINNPSLFFKAQQWLANERQTCLLQAGPEGIWRSQLHLVNEVVIKLIQLAPQLFTIHQAPCNTHHLMEILFSVEKQFSLLTETVRSLTHA